MYIHEAMSLAVANGMEPGRKKHIRRTTPIVWMFQKLEPRNDLQGCTIRPEKLRGKDDLFGRQWHPTVDDLMADDWELVNKPKRKAR